MVLPFEVCGPTCWATGSVSFAPPTTPLPQSPVTQPVLLARVRTHILDLTPPPDLRCHLQLPSALRWLRSSCFPGSDLEPPRCPLPQNHLVKT